MIWQGGFYVRHPERGPWQLHLELQSHEPTSAVFLNGHFLGYLPVKDLTYSWVSAILPVPENYLRQGYNELMIRSGHTAPQLQSPVFTWDDVLLRGVFLERLGSYPTGSANPAIRRPAPNAGP